MKRLLLLCLTYIMCVGNHQMAAQDSSESPGIFNSLAVGVSASTTGEVTWLYVQEFLLCRTLLILQMWM